MNSTLSLFLQQISSLWKKIQRTWITAFPPTTESPCIFLPMGTKWLSTESENSDIFIFSTGKLSRVCSEGRNTTCMLTPIPQSQTPPPDTFLPDHHPLGSASHVPLPHTQPVSQTEHTRGTSIQLGLHVAQSPTGSHVTKQSNLNRIKIQNVSGSLVEHQKEKIMHRELSLKLFLLLYHLNPFDGQQLFF